jgi:hypothetical protein
MLIAAVVLSGCAATQSNIVCDGNSKSMGCHSRTTTAILSTNQRGSSHGDYFANPSQEKVLVQHHKAISFKE